jgi:pyridoxal phosphate enzyme (YggS family)
VKDASGLTARYAALVREVGPRVKVVVATKYVDDDQLVLLEEAGVEIVGENRLQDLERKHERFAEAFQWHFIGQLQSRKAPEVSARVELVHSLASTSAARRLAVPALVQVNLSGEDSKSGVGAEELSAFLDEVTSLGVDVVGLSTMPPLATTPEDSRPYFRRLAELARELKLSELSMGTTQDYRVAVEEGATFVRVGSALFAG